MEKIWVKVPSPTDPALQNQGMLRKPGPRRYAPTENFEETIAGLRGAAVPHRPKWRPDYWTEEPELVELTPRVMRHLMKGNLVRCQPTGDVERRHLPETERRTVVQPMVDVPNQTTVAVANTEE